MLKQLMWIGSSRSDLRALPEEVQDDFGYALYQAQLGLFPAGAKPFKGLPSVIEIVENFDKNTYRVVYATKLGDRLYILHVFQKKSKMGIKTPKEEINVIKRRYQIAIEVARSR